MASGPAENKSLVGVQHNNPTHEAYAALGTDWGETFNNSSLVFLKLVTEDLQTTTLRVLGGEK